MPHIQCSTHFFFFGCCDKNVLSIEMVWSIPSLKRSIYKELPTIAIQDAMNYTAAFCLAFFFHRLHFEALSDTDLCREQYAKTSLWHALWHSGSFADQLKFGHDKRASRSGLCYPTPEFCEENWTIHALRL